ncbi:MAG: aspartyl protease family protein [Alistipes sp.]|nr:aspartyl protease family protein [Candidatus Alistipes equi]
MLENKQGHLLIDTGSPTSFHEDGFIELGDFRMEVPKDIFGIVDSKYLSDTLGLKIKGLLGMDFMGQHPTVFNTKGFGGFISFGDGFNDADVMEGFSIMGCPGIVIEVNRRPARVLVDSGANLSYIDKQFVRESQFLSEQEDFHPLLGTGLFTTDTYEVPCHIGCGNHKDKDLNVVFGILPAEMGLLLSAQQVDGVIGYDLFCNFRISLQDGKVVLPP